MEQEFTAQDIQLTSEDIKINLEKLNYVVIKPTALSMSIKRDVKRKGKIIQKIFYYVIFVYPGHEDYQYALLLNPCSKEETIIGTIHDIQIFEPSDTHLKMAKDHLICDSIDKRLAHNILRVFYGFCPLFKNRDWVIYKDPVTGHYVPTRYSHINPEDLTQAYVTSFGYVPYNDILEYDKELLGKKIN